MEQNATDKRLFTIVWRKLPEDDSFEEAKVECDPPARLRLGFIATRGSKKVVQLKTILKHSRFISKPVGRARILAEF